MVELKVNWCGI